MIERHERRQARAAAQPSDEQIVALAEEIAGYLCDTYICGRVWSAWQVGTMSEDDFAPVDKSDLPYDIACAVLALRPAVQPLTEDQREAIIGDSDGRWHDGEFRIDGASLVELIKSVERAHGIGLE